MWNYGWAVPTEENEDVASASSEHFSSFHPENHTAKKKKREKNVFLSNKIIRRLRNNTTSPWLRSAVGQEAATSGCEL